VSSRALDSNGIYFRKRRGTGDKPGHPVPVLPQLSRGVLLRNKIISRHRRERPVTEVFLFNSRIRLFRNRMTACRRFYFLLNAPQPSDCFPPGHALVAWPVRSPPPLREFFSLIYYLPARMPNSSPIVAQKILFTKNNDVHHAPFWASL